MTFFHFSCSKQHCLACLRWLSRASLNNDCITERNLCLIINGKCELGVRAVDWLYCHLLIIHILISYCYFMEMPVCPFCVLERMNKKKLGVILPLIWCFTDMHVKDCGNTQNKEVLARSLQFSRCYTATCSTFVRLLIFRLALVDPAWLSLEFYVNGTDTTVSFGGRSTQWLISLPVRQKKRSSLVVTQDFLRLSTLFLPYVFFVCWSFLTFSGSSTIHVLTLFLLTNYNSFTWF